MEKVFQKRRQAFRRRCISYLRYVLNDHFVLVLMVLVGFLLFQYQRLLQHFPQQTIYVWLLLGIITIFILGIGGLATYVEPADAQFLLVKEPEIHQQVMKAKKRAFLLRGVLQISVQVFLAPLYFKLGLTVWQLLVYLVLLLIAQFFIFKRKMAVLLSGNHLHWEKLIEKENHRKQGILRFFALFTTVKGVSTSVKRRAYLDIVTRIVQPLHTQTWDYLFIRGFLRSGDFFWVSVRLLLLSLVAIVGISEPILVVVLVGLLDYLLFFQLLALYSVYDYQYLAWLYPLSEQEKWQSFKRILSYITYGIVGIQLIVGLAVMGDKMYVLGFLGIALLLTQLYLPMKSKKLID